MGVEPAQVRQQRGVNVEHAALPSLDEGRAQDAHEPGEADDFGPLGAKPRVERRFERRLPRIDAEVDRLRRNARLARGRKTGRGRLVRQDEHDLGRKVRRARRLDKSAHVRAATRDENDRPRPERHNLSLPRVRSAGRRREQARRSGPATGPRRRAPHAPPASSSAETNAAIPKPQLKVRSISPSSRPPAAASQEKTGGGAKASRSSETARLSSSTRGRLSG